MTTEQLDETSIERVDGQGGSATVTQEDLNKFQKEIRQCVSQSLGDVWGRRETGEQIRLCYWGGQSPDGRKRKQYLNRDPIPYEGAPDRRIRAADMIVNEHVIVTGLAIMRMLAAIRVNSLQTHDPSRGARLTQVLRWILKNQIGRAQLRTIIEQMGNYTYGDAPGIGCLGVWWERESQLEERVLSADDIQTILIRDYGLNAREVLDAFAMVMEPEGEEEAAQWIGAIVGGERSEVRSEKEYGAAGAAGGDDQQDAGGTLSQSKAREMVRQLRTEGACRFPAPYWRVNGVTWCAYQLFNEIWLPDNTPTDAQRARWYLIRESLSEAELRERIVSHNYTEAFVEAVLKQGEARSILNLSPLHTGVTGDGSLGTTAWRRTDPDPRSHTYEVLTIYYRAVNEDNVPGVYYFPLNLDVTVPGHDRELLEYQLPRRKVYPFVCTQRETLNANLLDSRGVPEIAMTDQDALKLTADSRLGNAILRAFPPIESPRNRPNLKLKFSPLGQIKVDRRGEFGPVEMPDYPVGMTEEQVHIWNFLHRYFGLFAGEESNPMIAQLFNQWRADKMGDCILDACAMTLALAQQYMTDEELAKVCDSRTGVPVARSREDIQGEFGIDMDYNTAAMDLAYIKELAEVIGTMILPADTTSTIQRDRLVMWLMQAINPNMAEDVVAPVDEANSREAEDERNNIAQIAAGVEPEMLPEGQNFGLRLMVWQQALQKNPRMMDNWSPMSRQMAEARMEQLGKQYEQHNVNPQIGRTLGKQVT